MRAIRFLAIAVACVFAATARAEQGSIVAPTVGPKSAAELMTAVNAALVALQSCNSGNSAPANGPGGDTVEHQCWADTSANPVVYKRYDGASWVAFGKLDTVAHTWTPVYQGADLSTASIATMGTSGHVVPFLDGANTWSGVQSFNSGDLSLKGSSSGAGVLNAPAVASSYIWTLPAATGTIAYLGNKLSSFAATSSSELAGVISDETGTGAIVFANAPTLIAPNLGTPSAVNLSNATNLPVATGISGLSTGIATWLATPSSANLAAAVTNETGSGALVFGTSPNITTPTGIVKGDVGLGNVDNTSDATKNGAIGTLTNKTIDTASNTFRLNGAAFGTATQATAALNVVTGDSGTGGLKGLVPAPGAGDAAAGKYLDAAGGYSVPAGGGGGGMTNEERQNFLLSIVDQSKSSLGYRRLINLYATGFKGGTDAANGIDALASSNYTPNASSGFYAPSPTTTQVQISPFGSDAGQGAPLTIVDRTTAITNGRVLQSIGIYSTSARTISLKVFQVTNTTDGTFVLNQSVAHPGGGFVDFNLTSPYTVPGSGTFYLAAGMQNGTLSFTNSLASRLSFAGDVTGAQTGGTSGAGIAFPMRYNYVTGVASMTLVTVPQTTAANVSNARAGIEFDNVASLSLNVDLTAEVSCDNTNWAPATLSTVTTNSRGGLKYVETADTACTAGASFGLRVKNPTSKNVPIYSLTLKVH